MNLKRRQVELVDEDLADDDEGSRRLRPVRYGCCCYWQPQNLLIVSSKKVKGSRPDDKIQSPRSPRSAPINEG
jgi:hypothetical protein